MNNSITYTKYGSTTIIRTTCFVCGEESEITVPTNQFDNYVRGMYVQDAFPNMSVQDREKIISGMCENCQKQFFEAEEREVV